MKTLKASLLTIVILLMTVVAIQAQTIRVVDNNPNAPSGENVFSTIQEAHDAADPGDILHIVGSNTTYAGANLSKSLTILGDGMNPDPELDTHFNSRTGTLTFSNQLDAISEIHIRGLETSITLTGNTEFGVVEIKNNIIGSVSASSTSISVNTLRITNNVISSFSVRNASVLNNVVTNASSTTGSQVINNLFIAGGLSGSGSIINNNIFFGGSVSGGLSTSTLNFNLITGNNNNEFPIGENGNTGSNNLYGVNPQFIDLPLNGGSWNFDWDPRLQEGSPAIGAGSEGTDMGVFGGSFPFNALINPGGPLPYIRVLNTSGVIQPGQDLLIEVEAVANQQN
jgi:hypothetical protein